MRLEITNGTCMCRFFAIFMWIHGSPLLVATHHTCLWHGITRFCHDMLNNYRLILKDIFLHISWRSVTVITLWYSGKLRQLKLNILWLVLSDRSSLMGFVLKSPPHIRCQFSACKDSRCCFSLMVITHIILITNMLDRSSINACYKLK